MRLSCCHGVSSDVNCGDKYLNTTLWKESIIADITFIQGKTLLTLEVGRIQE